MQLSWSAYKFSKKRNLWYFITFCIMMPYIVIIVRSRWRYLGYIKTKVANPIDYETVNSLYGTIDVNGSPSLHVPLQVEITVADNYGSTSQIFNAALLKLCSNK